MGWEIPSTKQERNVIISRPKDSLLTSINQLKTTDATEFLEKHSFEKNTNKIVQDSNLFDKNWQKDEQAENFKHRLLSRYLLIKSILTQSLGS